MAALAQLYQVSPSIQAAKTVLVGQLLSSGVVVRRQGRDVPLKESFSRHLESVWLPFARDVIDQFLVFGFCLVSLEREAPAPFAAYIKGRDAVGQTDMGLSDEMDRQRQRPPDAAGYRATRRAPAPCPRASPPIGRHACCR